MEDELHHQYCELRDKSLIVKSQWFEAKSKELMMEMHPELEFEFPDGWFTAFKQRKSINYHSTTNVSQVILNSRSVSSTSSYANLQNEMCDYKMR